MIALSLWTWQNQSRSSRQAINMVHIWSVPKFQNKEDRALILQGRGQLWEPSRMRYGVMGRFIQGREERKRSWAPPSGNCCICGLLLVSNVKVCWIRVSPVPLNVNVSYKRLNICIYVGDLVCWTYGKDSHGHKKKKKIALDLHMHLYSTRIQAK